MLSLVLLAVAAGTSWARETVSTWQGTFEAGGELHRAVLQMTEEVGAQKKVRVLYIDFFPEAIKVDASTIVKSHLALATNDR